MQERISRKRTHIRARVEESRTLSSVSALWASLMTVYVPRARSCSRPLSAGE